MSCFSIFCGWEKWSLKRIGPFIEKQKKKPSGTFLIFNFVCCLQFFVRIWKISILMIDSPNRRLIKNTSELNKFHRTFLVFFLPLGNKHFCPTNFSHKTQTESFQQIFVSWVCWPVGHIFGLRKRFTSVFFWHGLQYVLDNAALLYYTVEHV